VDTRDVENIGGNIEMIEIINKLNKLRTTLKVIFATA